MVALEPKLRPVLRQLEAFPDTRYMGSKRKLGPFLLEVLATLEFETALDAMSGSGLVAYLMKAMGKATTANDYLEFCSEIAQASVANSRITLSADEVEFLCTPNPDADDFIRRTFRGLYFGDEDNAFLDHFSANVRDLKGASRSLALAAIVSSSLKARPRGVFTYVGRRYDDGRRDLRLSLDQQFREAVARWNAAVFDNGRINRALNLDVFSIKESFDLVYLDPPYVSPHSDNEYTRRYHFVEGLMSYWTKVQIQDETKTKKFPNKPSLFSSKRTIHEAFDRFAAQFPESTLVISYSSSGIPAPQELVELLKKHRKRVEVFEQPHSYSFGTHSHLRGNGNNRVLEYVFVAHR